MSDLRVHTVRTGRLVGNITFWRGEGWSSLRRRQDLEYPVQSFVIEHPEGPIAIDTGLRSPRPLTQRRFAPNPVAGEEVGPAMRAIGPAMREVGPAMRAIGPAPADVRKVVLTHLDWDHAGGLAHFPHAEVLVHRPEHEFARTRMGRWRYEPDLWPPGFEPTVYDLDPEPYGPFPRSKALTESGDVRIVPIPGHSVGQVGVIVRSGDLRLLFAADHVLRQDWFLEDFETREAAVSRDRGGYWPLCWGAASPICLTTSANPGAR